jgi:hypothetical protein
VSVCGTVTGDILEAFLGSMVRPTSEPKLSSSGLGNAAPWIFLRSLPTPLIPLPERGDWLTLLRPPIDTSSGSTGMLTRFPSATPFGLALGPTNPERIDLAQETLGFRRTRFSRVLSLLVPAGSLPYPPPVLVGRTSNGYGMLLYHRDEANPVSIRSFGGRLEPRWIIGAAPLDQ